MIGTHLVLPYAKATHCSALGTASILCLRKCDTLVSVQERSVALMLSTAQFAMCAVFQGCFRPKAVAVA